jgi:hypothetical protein
MWQGTSTMSFRGNAREFVQHGNCTGIQVHGGKNGIQPTSESLTTLDRPQIDGGAVDRGGEARPHHEIFSFG